VVIGMADSSAPLTLVRGLSRATWLARLDDSPVIARAVAALPAHTVDSPLLVPVIGTAELDGTTWLLSEEVDGASVQRLLGLATLTPAQAGWLAAQALAGLATLHEAGLAHGRLHAGNVLVGRDGAVHLADWALGPPASEQSRRADLAAARTFVAALTRNADRPSARHGGLLAELERLAAEPIADAAAVVRELDAVSDPVTMRFELGTLVAAMSRTSTSVVTPPPLPARLPHHRRPPARHPSQRLRMAVVATLLVLAAAVVFVAVSHRRHAAAPAPSPSHALRTRVHSPTPRSIAPSPVAAVAPRSAGFVDGVVLTPVTSCQPGAACSVTVTIRIVAHSDVKHLRWTFVLVDPCTGARTEIPGGSMTAQPSWQHIYSTTTVTLPQTRSVTVVAMTTTPVRAASAPLTVRPGRARC
jgi:tRNA A-37 threonylcarbamoyl transferase component Bud32